MRRWSDHSVRPLCQTTLSDHSDLIHHPTFLVSRLTQCLSPSTCCTPHHMKKSTVASNHIPPSCDFALIPLSAVSSMPSTNIVAASTSSRLTMPSTPTERSNWQPPRSAYLCHLYRNGCRIGQRGQRCTISCHCRGRRVGQRGQRRHSS